ncbi:MAG: M50 family metallopeptidase, partial [Myxococcales bacterium]
MRESGRPPGALARASCCRLQCRPPVRRERVIDFKKLFALAAALAVGIFLWDSKLVYPLKLLVVLIHEAGHALAAKAVGGEVLSITVNEMQ